MAVFSSNSSSFCLGCHEIGNLEISQTHIVVSSANIETSVYSFSGNRDSSQFSFRVAECKHSHATSVETHQVIPLPIFLGAARGSNFGLETEANFQIHSE